MRNGLKRFLWAPLLASAILPVAGCETGTAIPGRDGGRSMTDGSTPGGSCRGGSAGFTCEGRTAIECAADGSELSRSDCGAQVCVNGLGCRTCRPSTSYQCIGESVERCNADGTGYEPFRTCDAAAGETCNSISGACTSLCNDAAASNSYIGCEYWPVTTSNSQVDSGFAPAVVVANPQTVPANVSVTGPAGFSVSRSVAPGATETIELRWVDALKGRAGSEATALVPGGAYRLTSSVPVTVYQFNPLEYQSRSDFSFTNDASLLLPSHVLTGNYIVLGRPSMYNRFDGSTGGSPGFFTVVSASETPVSVDITFRGRTVAGSSIPAFNPGQTGTFTLNRGDALQIVGAQPTSCSDWFTETITIPAPLPFFPPTTRTLEYCRVGPDFDLTGTEIRATGPIQVIAGHNCAFVPFNRWACDHLEEAMFPLEAWGTESIVSRTLPPMGRTDPNVVRIISGRDGNVLSFDPVPPGVTSGMTLNRGQVVEFETTQSFRVQGTQALMVAQFLVGQDYAGYNSAGDNGQGDPAMSLAIPTEQFRTSYSFLTPSTYPTGYVNVTAPNGATVMLDGSPVSGFAPVGSTGFSVAQVSVRPGQHSISSDRAFGIVVYGYGSYTSYMFPGGLDLNEINIPF